MAGTGVPPHVAELTGPLLIGLGGSWGLLGTSSIQVYNYYLRFPKDSWALKTLVYGLYIWDVLQTFLFTATVFNAIAGGWGNPAALEDLSLTWFDTPIMSGLASTTVQCFYAWRIYVLGKSIPLSIFIVALALLEGGAAFAFGIIVKTQVRSFSDLRSKTFVVTSVWLWGSATCDVVISVCMLALLFRARKSYGRHGTGNTLSRLIRLSVGGGVITTSIAIVDAVLFIVFQKNNYHAGPDAILAKLYTNALMVLFNSRQIITDSYKQSSIYVWDGEGGHRHVATFDKSFGNVGAISVDVNVDRITDPPNNTFPMQQFDKRRNSVKRDSNLKSTWNINP